MSVMTSPLPCVSSCAQELQREVQSLKVDLGSKVSATTALEREVGSCLPPELEVCMHL